MLVREVPDYDANLLRRTIHGPDADCTYDWFLISKKDFYLIKFIYKFFY